MRYAGFGIVALLVGCRPSPADPPVRDDERPSSSSQAGPTPESAPETPRGEIPAGPGLVVRGHGEIEIELYAVYIVDASGELGTRALWPHRFDCPEVEAPPHTLPAGGKGWLPAPTEAYEGESCTPTPLPPGDYVIRIHSGYGEDYYAAAAVTLPLTGPVEFELKSHDGPPPCDETRARRAATLAVTAAREADALPAAFLRDCDLSTPRCGTLPLEDTMPPERCTVTLHETLLRIERPAGSDAVRSLEAWVDREVVYARRPDVRATSASRFVVEGKPVVIAGVTGRARHEHGGDAARIGHATFEVDNPLDRAVPVRAKKVEFLTDHSCGLPSEVRARPRVSDVSAAELPPGRSQLEVMFEPQGAYQSHCDRFAARVTFAVGGKRAPVTVEYEVMRFERMRESR